MSDALADVVRKPDIAGHLVSRMSLADADDWAAYASRPEMLLHVSSPISGVADVIPMIERTLSDDAGAPVMFAVRSAATGELVATVGFHTVSALNRTAEITYNVRTEHWGRGLGALVCDAAVRWGFDERSWVRIQATVLEPNVASIRVLQKSGFAFEGHLRNFRMVRGRPSDYLLYSRVPGEQTEPIRSPADAPAIAPSRP